MQESSHEDDEQSSFSHPLYYPKQSLEIGHEISPFIVEGEEQIEVPALSETQYKVARAQFLALCWAFFLIGWNDGTLGPLLPRIREVYNVGYATVSLIFVFGCAGTLVGALSNMPLNDKFGLGKILLFASVFQIAAFTIQASAMAFPLFLISYTIGGFGIAIQDALGNAFISAVKHDGEKKMGLLHAAYGLGALISPLSATHFAHTPHWTFHYLFSLVFSMSNLVILFKVFGFQGLDECLARAGEKNPENEYDAMSSDNKYSQLLRLKAVHLIALFLLVYVGVEVTIGGWTVTFIMVERGGGVSSGYISSGFFGGLTLGRVILIGVNQKLGDKYAIYVYTTLALLCQFVIWFIPSMLVGSLVILCIGVLLGPLYPIAITHSARVIPRSLVTGAIGWIGACSAAGSSLLPFVTGALASKFGIWILQPLLVLMITLMGVVWFMVP